jgi:hypothetical protein
MCWSSLLSNVIMVGAPEDQDQPHADCHQHYQALLPLLLPPLPPLCQIVDFLPPPTAEFDDVYMVVGDPTNPPTASPSTP